MWLRSARILAGKIVEVRQDGGNNMQVRMSRGSVRPLRVSVVTGLVVASMTMATAALGTSITHPSVVLENPSNDTARLVPDAAVARPYANAVGQSGNRMFVGGRFETVLDGSGSPQLARQNFMIFDADTGAVADSPAMDSVVWAIEPYTGADPADPADDAVFVGGEFTDVDGVPHRRLVKLDAATGAVDPDFNPTIGGGQVKDLHMYNGAAGPMLFAAGSVPTKPLMALDPETGANTGYFNNVNINTPIPNAFGSLSVNNVAISPAGTELVGVGNFSKVGAAARKRVFRLNLGATTPTLSPWYYKPFAEDCNVTTARRLAYATDVDYSPDGTWFVISATGHVSAPRDANKTVCDGVARFETDGPNNPFRPTWINYTGGDTIWSVATSGAAAYVQGHFQHLDVKGRLFGENLNDDAVDRLGVGAVDPGEYTTDASTHVTTTVRAGGKALDWDPAKPATQGGKQLLVTDAGLWVASDSKRFAGEPRYGIAFAPLP